MKCWKCDGKGTLPQYAHIENGVCFACGGSGRLDAEARKDLAKDYAKKGSRPSGSLSNLLKTEHDYLDKEELLKYRKALAKHAKKHGIVPKAGFRTAKLKKDLQEITGRDEHGMKPSEKPSAVAVAEPPKTEEPPAYVFKATATMKKPKTVSNPDKRRPILPEDGVYQQTGEDAELFAEGMNFYNKFGHRIISPYRRHVPEEVTNAERNNLKPLGNPFANFIRKETRKYIDEKEAEYGRGKGFLKGLEDDLMEIAEDLEIDFGGVLANVAFDKFEYKNRTNIGGSYIIGTRGSDMWMSLSINPEFLEQVHRTKSNLSPDDFQVKRSKMKRILKKVFFHEIAHAFHHQALSDRRSMSFEGNNSMWTPMANKINDVYNAKLARLEAKGYRKGLVQNEHASVMPVGKDAVDAIKGEFGRTYGAMNAREMFAVFNEFLATPAGVIFMENNFPEELELLRELYKGVITI